jgi:hypothetical protein
MKFILSTLLILLITSCGFISSDEEQDVSQAEKTNPLTQGLAPSEDYDGDLVTNEQEQLQGRSPIIADIPSVRIRFLQNYKISFEYKSLSDGTIGNFEINTSTHQDNPDFKYRVGEVFIRNESFNAAASIGKFSTHSWGNMNEHDLSWVSYPEADTRFYSEKVLKYKAYFNKEKFEITNISIVLENNIKLKANTGLGEIKNLSLNFYYYDYEKESFELLETSLVKRNFQAGINETFEVTLDNVPEKLLSTNYFQKGEFIISELGDYEIPSMKTTYKKLLISVKEKSVPVIYNTPLNSEVSYVGVNGGTASLSTILNSLYGNKAIIEQNKLRKINQFETNLPDFIYLKEIREHDKKGKWFVFTNQLRQHYLDHQFSPKDIISLSYITGKTLSAQRQEKVVSYRENADSSDSRKLFALGNVSPNSRIHFQFRPKALWGEQYTQTSDTVTNTGRCSGNCYRADLKCHIQVNLFGPINQKLEFSSDFTKILPKINLLVNQQEYSLSQLLSENKLDLHWVGENIHIDIKNISAIQEINDIDENVLSLKLQRKIETTFNGVYLTGAEGQRSTSCTGIATQLAGSKGWPLSTRSWRFGEWQQTVNWARVTRGEDKTYTQDFSLGITSTITNFFN